MGRVSVQGRAAGRIGPWERTFRLVLVGAFCVALYWGGDALLPDVRAYVRGEVPGMGIWLVLLAFTAYVLFMAVPFVPGIEVGLVLMVLGGTEGILLVYAATLLALSLSYLAGRLIPLPAFGRGLAWLGLRRARALLEDLAQLEPAERVRTLIERAPTRFIPFLVRHRYVAVALALNLPGNAVIGGGGGIGLVAGLSGLFPLPRYLALVAVAILPVPVALLLRLHA